MAHSPQKRAAHTIHQRTRREFLRTAAGAAALATGAGGGRLLASEAAGLSATSTAPSSRPVARAGMPVKAFCIDFNWGAKGASEPGLYAQADPAEHVRWYQDLGANVIQTFCVSYNGYAWYPSTVAPITPGMKTGDFLGDMVNLGHKAGMRVMGYFTLGANPYWEQHNPELVHGSDSDYIKIPFTLEYLDYFCRSVEDALLRTGVDGFMIDWIRPTQHKKWLACEKEMYRQLLSEPFPASGEVPAAVALQFDRLAIARAWRHIRRTVKATRPVIIWTNHPILEAEYPLWENHPLLKEVDWLLNESPELGALNWLRNQVGRDTLIVQNLCGWEGHDASACTKIDAAEFGLYGFAKADAKTTLADAQRPANIRNISLLRECFRHM